MRLLYSIYYIKYTLFYCISELMFNGLFKYCNNFT